MDMLRSRRDRSARERAAAIGRTSVVVIAACAGLVYVFLNFSGFIRANLPYVGHWDEPYLSGPAANILKTNNFNPQHFYYPALPIYVTTFGMALGYLQDVVANGLYSPEDLGRFDFPSYERPLVALYAKMIFMLAGLGCIVIVMVIVCNESRNIYLTLLVTPLFLCSYYLVHQTKLYMNVDIVASFFAMLCLCYALVVSRLTIAGSAFYGWVVPAVLCGLVISSKYNYFPIVFPFLYLYVKHHPRWKEAAVFFLLATAAVFLLVNPYIFPDFSKFLYYTAVQMQAYGSGLPGLESEPGLEQLLYHLKSIADNFSVVFCLCAVGGMVWLCRKKREHFLVMASFFVPYVALVSSQRLHYLRNFLTIYLLSMVFACLGVYAFYGLAAKIPALPGKANKGFAVALSAMAFFFCLNMDSVQANLRMTKDTRHIVSEIINANIATGERLVVFNELGFPGGTFGRYHVRGLAADDILSPSFPRDIPSGALCILPRFGSGSGSKEAVDKAARLNERIEQSGLTKVLELPGESLALDMRYPISNLSPAVGVYHKP